MDTSLNHSNFQGSRQGNIINRSQVTKRVIDKNNTIGLLTIDRDDKFNSIKQAKMAAISEQRRIALQGSKQEQKALKNQYKNECEMLDDIKYKQQAMK